AHGQVTGLVDSLAKILAGLEVRHVLARQRDGLARLGGAAQSGRAVVKREAAEPANLDSLAARERLAHELQNVLDRQLDVFGGQVFLTAGDRFDQLRLCHGYGLPGRGNGSRGLTPESSSP